MTAETPLGKTVVNGPSKDDSWPGSPVTSPTSEETAFGSCVVSGMFVGSKVVSPARSLASVDSGAVPPPTRKFSNRTAATNRFGDRRPPEVVTGAVTSEITCAMLFCR